MTPVFPALLIGGPPHSGKSTLTYRLRKALLERGISFYALRASPDGEGNWINEAPRSLIAELRKRAKDRWSAELAVAISRDVGNRHLPLLVDAGGIASPETAMIAAQCTHALLIAANPPDLAPWHELVETNGLALVAELQSSLHENESIIENVATMRGVISSLDTAAPDWPCFAELVDRVAQLFAYDADELYRTHLALTDLDLVLHVQRQIYPLPAHTVNDWRPDELPELVASLPPATPLGIYGIGPVWLYAALAALGDPARCAVFDVRHGWVEPPTLALADEAHAHRLRWDERRQADDYTHLLLSIPGTYLDPRDAAGVAAPQLPVDRGVVLDGKLPNWLWAALVRTYRDLPWVAVYQPRLHGAVVVRTRDPSHAIGKVIPIDDPLPPATQNKESD